MMSRSENDVGEDLVRQYLREIGSYELLTAADEVELARAIEAGNEARTRARQQPRRSPPAPRRELEATATTGTAATKRFIQSNLRLVVSIAKRYQSSGLPLLDLVQEGNLGLMRAVEKFDHRKGFKFSTYATWWIRQAISRGHRRQGPHDPRARAHGRDGRRRSGGRRHDCSRSLGREATPEEIARETGLTPDRVLEAQRVAPDPVSLFEQVGDDNAELVDFLEDRNAEAPFEAAAAAIQTSELRAVLRSLSEREQRVLELRFGLIGERPRTLEEVGQEFCLTRERIRQIEAKALSKLRHPSTPPSLRDLAAL